ncbi:Putative ribonuclease H protein At1g65750 [Linum perenne]
MNHDLIDLESSVADFTTASGAWDLDRLRQFLNEEIIGEIMGLLPPESEKGDDSWVWSGKLNGKFSIRSGYDLIVKPTDPDPTAPWKLVWKWRGPARVQHFLRLMTHDKLLTNLEWKQRHLTSDSSCTRCGHLEDSVIHIVRDCPSVPKVWDELGISNHDPLRRSLVLPNGVLTYSLTLNLSNCAAAGGLLRNEAGYYLSAFSFNLGKCSVTRAELRSAIIGLELAWEAGHRKVAAQVDSQVVISLFRASDDLNHQFATEAAGVPYVNPYLNKSLDHTYDTNFTVGGVGYLSKETRNKWDIHLSWSQSSVDVQMNLLEQHLTHTFPDAAC